MWINTNFCIVTLLHSRVFYATEGIFLVCYSIWVNIPQSGLKTDLFFHMFLLFPYALSVSWKQYKKSLKNILIDCKYLGRHLHAYWHITNRCTCIYIQICIPCVMHTHTRQVLTILLVLVTNVSHFSMYIICVTDGYPGLCWQDFSTVQIFVLQGMPWSSDVKRSELNMWGLTYCYLLEEKYQGTLHFAIMKYPFRMNYAATGLCIYK